MKRIRVRHVGRRRGGRGSSCPPRFWLIRSRRRAAAVAAPHYYMPPRFLDFATCLRVNPGERQANSSSRSTKQNQGNLIRRGCLSCQENHAPPRHHAPRRTRRAHHSTLDYCCYCCHLETKSERHSDRNCKTLSKHHESFTFLESKVYFGRQSNL